MKNLNYLKNLLYDDVKSFNEQLENIEGVKTRIDLYQELISIFNKNNIDYFIDNLLTINKQLEALYGKNFVNFWNLEKLFYDCKNGSFNQKQEARDLILKLLDRLNSDYLYEKDNLRQLEASVDFQTIKNSRKVITALKYNQKIGFHLLDFIKERLSKENLQDKEIIYIIELINIHNSKINNNDRLNSDELYYLINLLRQGYEEIKLPKINNDKLDIVADNIIEMLNNNDIKTCEVLLNSLNYYSVDELNYIYRKIMLFYQNSIFEIIEILKDKDNYFDKEIVSIIKTDYYIAYSKYMIARILLDNLPKNNEEEKELNVNEIDDVKLYYSTNSHEPHKCYFVSDLMDIREESLKVIADLIDKFKKGIKSNVKYLSFEERFIELKDDQIRVVLKPMGDNNYSVMGVFIKKSDNDRNAYNNIHKRPIAKIDNEYSLLVEEYYQKYIAENVRKGSR